MARPADLLSAWLVRQLEPAAAERWAALQARAAGDAAAWTMAVALVPRQLGKAPLALDEADRAEADAARPGWRPWLQVDQAARLALILDPDPALVFERVERLARSADTGELATLLTGLPLYPEPERYRARAAEGVRTNIRDLFLAVAHRNPYPSEQLDEGAWNQLVLKALFIEVGLDPIVGLDRRCNPALGRMLGDYAAERRAASRAIPLELWRCLGPYPEERGLELMQWQLGQGEERERDAAALGLAAAGAAGAEVLVADAERAARVADGSLDWTTLLAS